jgi:hypothetical protein
MRFNTDESNEESSGRFKNPFKDNKRFSENTCGVIAMENLCK